MGDVRTVVPLDRELPAPFEHRPGVGADHRDAAHRVELGGLVVGQRRNLDHLLDTLDLERLGGVVGLHLAAVDGRPRHHRDLHPRNGGVGAEVGAAGAHVVVVDHRHVAADVLPLRRVLELRGGVALRHRDVGGRVDHLAEVEGSTAGAVVEPVVLRVDLACVHAPLLRRRLLQHVAAGRAELAHDVEMMARAARAVGVLAVLAGRVVLRLVARRLPDRDPVPVGLQLVGENHRDAGAHALAHLGAAAGDGHQAVVRDGDEQVGRNGHSGALGPDGRDHRARDDLRAEYEGAGGAGLLQEVTPADVLYARHVTPPARRCAPRRRFADRCRNGRCSRPFRRRSRRRSGRGCR